MDAVKSINVAGATIVVQACMLIIVALGVACSPDLSGRQYLSKSRSYCITLLLTLVSVLIIAITKDFYRVWSPVLGDLRIPTISSSTGLSLVFSFDIIVVTVLMFGSGGSKDSPFTSVLFMLPALAIFLREPPHRFLSYALAVMLVYILGLRYKVLEPGGTDLVYDERYGTRPVMSVRAASSFAHGIVNIACLGAAMLTGYITRPLPI